MGRRPLDLPIQLIIGGYPEYIPPATGKRKAYVKPGNLGWGIASWAIKPTTAVPKPSTIKYHRVLALSERKDKVMVRIAANT